MTFIIAEVGSNWRNLDDCLTSIRQAKWAGADAVKFQAFDYESLYGVSPVQMQRAFGILQATLNIEWLPRLKAECDKVGIEFMCTAFSPDLYDAVDPYVARHKVASAECTHVRILERVRGYGKPVILSTGAHGEADIAAALDVLAGRNTQAPDAVPIPVTLLYCVANYPAQVVDLRVIFEMHVRFGVPVGYSDHTTDVLEIPVSAAECGASVLEKHFTAIPEIDTPDRGHALTPLQFKSMVMAIRGEHVPYRIGYTNEETPMVLRHNRRLIATRDIPRGGTFIEGENFGIYRSLKEDTHGLSPFCVNQVNAMRAARDLKAGDAIGLGDCE